MTLVTFGLGNIIGTEIFQPKDSPEFLPGKITILVLLTAQLFICFLLRAINLNLNKKKKAALAEMQQRNGWNEEEIQREREKHAFLDLTDKQYVTPVFFDLNTLDWLITGIHSSYIRLREDDGDTDIIYLIYLLSLDLYSELILV